MIREYKDFDKKSVMTIWYDAQTIAHPFLSKEFISKVKTLMNDVFIPNSKTWVYEVEGEIKGFIAMMNNEIGGLFVNPEEQSKGIGTLLVDYMSQHYETLEVEVFAENKIGRPFYVKKGFKTIKEYLHEESQQEVIRMQL